MKRRTKNQTRKIRKERRNPRMKNFRFSAFTSVFNNNKCYLKFLLYLLFIYDVG